MCHYIYTTVALTSITLLSDTSVGLMPYLKAGGVDGLSHLWFMKAIAVSYLITPILQLGRKYPFCLFTLVLLIGFVEYAYLQINLFMFSWIWLYALGYYFAILTDKVKQIVISFITVLFIALSMNISWYDMLNYDGVYNRVWHDLGGVVLCLGGIIILTLCNITKIPKWIVLFDRNSFYLYITHHIYLIGPLSIVPFIHNIPMCILVTLFLIIVSSVLLAYISKIVINRINSKFL